MRAGLRVIGSALGRLQMDREECHASRFRQRLDLRNTEPRLRLRVGRVQRTGIGDQHHVAAAELRPVHLVDRDPQAGDCVLVELLGRDGGGAHRLERRQDRRGRLRQVGRGHQARDVFQLRTRADVGAIGDHAEAEIVAHRGVADAGHDAADRLPRAVDIGLHRDGAVDDEDDAAAEIAHARRVGLLRCLSQFGGGGDHFQRAHLRAVAALDGLGLQDRQQIEIALDVDEGLGLQRQHGAAGLAGGGAQGHRLLRHVGRSEQPAQRGRITQEHRALTPRGVGEGANHGVTPVDRAILAHPAIDVAVSLAPDLDPAIAPRVDMRDGEARNRAALRRIGLHVQRGTRAQDDALEQRGLARDQQRRARRGPDAALLRLRHLRQQRGGGEQQQAARRHCQKSLRVSGALMSPSRARSSSHWRSRARGSAAAASPAAMASR